MIIFSSSYFENYKNSFIVTWGWAHCKTSSMKVHEHLVIGFFHDNQIGYLALSTKY